MHSRRRLRCCGVLIIAGLTSLSAAQAPAQTPSPDYPERPPAPAEQVARGQQIFRSNCSFCHGSDARGGETGPNLVREVKSNNATLYDNLAMQPSPVGKSGVLGKGLMSISVNKATKFPNASIALAQFFTNPRSMVQFAKQVSVYPSSAAAYDDPFFSDVPTAVEDSARPLAEGIISTYQDIVPTIPKKADVNEVVLKAIEQALFNKVPAQQALSDAVKAANKLIQ